jgi:DNA-binding SARP family transcriptional activator
VDIWYDVDAFREQMAAYRRAPAGSLPAVEALGRAIDLYAGDYLVDCYRDWALRLRDDLQSQYVLALVALAEVLETRGEHTDAIQLYRRVLKVDDLREDVHRALMRCYAASGDRASAVRHYRQLRNLLDRELQVEPMPQTVALFEEIRAAQS